MPYRHKRVRGAAIQRSFRSERGVALVEFALVLPLLMLLLFGLIDFGQAFTMWTDETHLANQAGRYAAVNNSPNGGKVEASLGAADFEAAMEQQADTDRLKDAFAVPGFGIEVCFPPPAPGEVIGDRGQAVRVDATAQYDFFKFIADIPGMPDPVVLKAHSVMRIESAYDLTFANANACP